MSNSGSSGGGSSFSQGTFAARPAATPNALYFATDTGEWWIANAAGNAWQSIKQTSANVFGTPGGAQSLFFIGNAATWGQQPGGSGASTDVGTTTGNVIVHNVGSGFRAAEGANAKQGVATLVAGTVTVANTSVTANSRIIITPQETGALTGIVRVSARVVGTSFTLTSTVGTDTAVIAWEIFEPG